MIFQINLNDLEIERMTEVLGKKGPGNRRRMREKKNNNFDFVFDMESFK